MESDRETQLVFASQAPQLNSTRIAVSRVGGIDEKKKNTKRKFTRSVSAFIQRSLRQKLNQTSQGAAKQIENNFVRVTPTAGQMRSRSFCADVFRLVVT
jgi:hypothetical protein